MRTGVIDSLLKQLRAGQDLLGFPRQEDDTTFHMRYNGYVQPKERPRAKNGVFYTPTKTRAFEDKVKTTASIAMLEHKMPLLIGPLEVLLTILDEINEDWEPTRKKLAVNNLIVKQHGDLDNKVKAITDALNGVVYKDDRQIVSISITRKYSLEAGFQIIVRNAPRLKRSEEETLVRAVR